VVKAPGDAKNRVFRKTSSKNLKEGQLRTTMRKNENSRRLTHLARGDAVLRATESWQKRLDGKRSARRRRLDNFPGKNRKGDDGRREDKAKG